jgi:hypothetical protein
MRCRISTRRIGLVMIAEGNYEWKVTLGIWTALATLTGISLTDKIVVQEQYLWLWASAFVVAIVLLHGLWQKNIAGANDTDRDKANHYANLMAAELRIPLLPPELRRKERQRRRGLKNYANLIQLSVTVIFGLALVGAVWLRTHQPQGVEHNAATSTNGPGK